MPKPLALPTQRAYASVPAHAAAGRGAGRNAGIGGRTAAEQAAEPAEHLSASTAAGAATVNVHQRGHGHRSDHAAEHALEDPRHRAETLGGAAELPGGAGLTELLRRRRLALRRLVERARRRASLRGVAETELAFQPGPAAAEQFADFAEVVLAATAGFVAAAADFGCAGAAAGGDAAGAPATTPPYRA
jgi:hypothetical protein